MRNVRGQMRVEIPGSEPTPKLQYFVGMRFHGCSTLSVSCGMPVNYSHEERGLEQQECAWSGGRGGSGGSGTYRQEHEGM
jgi:hypothetical protein